VFLSNLLSGLVVGLVFGIVLQRGRFCFNTALRGMLFHKDYTLMKAVGAAIAIEMIGFQLFASTGLLQLYPRGLYWGANILGGFMFGVGMAIAGGCIMGITYRSGEGAFGSLVAVIGFAVGGGITLSDLVVSFRNTFQAMTEIQFHGLSPTIPLAVGVPSWFVIVPLSTLLLLVVARSYQKEKETGSNTMPSRNGWYWWRTGIAIGLISVISYPVAEAGGRSSPLALTGGYVGILGAVVYQNLGFMGWEQTMALGALLGAAVAALFDRECKIQIPTLKALTQSFLGGLMMGVGAILGDGCNITAILIGVPLLSLGGILAGAFMVLGCFAASWLTK
jgi:uncharacterized membrane protein YedE/YeeE